MSQNGPGAAFVCIVELMSELIVVKKLNDR